MAERKLPHSKLKFTAFLAALIGLVCILGASFYLSEALPWLLPVAAVITPAVIAVGLFLTVRRARPWVWDTEAGTVGPRKAQFPIAEFVGFNIREIGKSYRGVETRSQLELQFQKKTYLLQDALDTFGRHGHDEATLATLDEFMRELSLSAEEHARYEVWSQRAHLVTLTSHVH